jgi:hypothetical protein
MGGVVIQRAVEMKLFQITHTQFHAGSVRTGQRKRLRTFRNPKPFRRFIFSHYLDFASGHFIVVDWIVANYETGIGTRMQVHTNRQANTQL